MRKRGTLKGDENRGRGNVKKGECKIFYGIVNQVNGKVSKGRNVMQGMNGM